MGPGATAKLVDPPRRAAALPPDARRSMIVAAALPLLLEQGEMVKTRDIAAAAGIAEGTIFRAFATKDDLIAAVIEAALDTAALDQALSSVDPDLPLEERVAEAVAILQQRVVDVWRLASSVGGRFAEHYRRPTVASEPLVRLFEASRAELRIDPAVAARTLRAFTLAATHPLMADAPMSPADIAAQFLHGAAGATPERRDVASKGAAAC
jgi:AcrR family transcriptional regulator